MPKEGGRKNRQHLPQNTTTHGKKQDPKHPPNPVKQQPTQKNHANQGEKQRTTKPQQQPQSKKENKAPRPHCSYRQHQANAQPNSNPHQNSPDSATTTTSTTPPQLLREKQCTQHPAEHQHKGYAWRRGLTLCYPTAQHPAPAAADHWAT
ncbi:hypothetical protein Ancab_002110 [Ancistrocladus abbreviatus]